jgi:hypothetical protein
MVADATPLRCVCGAPLAIVRQRTIVEDVSRYFLRGA